VDAAVAFIERDHALGVLTPGLGDTPARGLLIRVSTSGTVIVSDAIAGAADVFVQHARPRLSPRSRLLLCQRVAVGRPVAQVAAQMGVSRQTGYR
jgi:leucine-zipper of insertion element IS481